MLVEAGLNPALILVSPRFLLFFLPPVADFFMLPCNNIGMVHSWAALHYIDTLQWEFTALLCFILFQVLFLIRRVEWHFQCDIGENM